MVEWDGWLFWLLLLGDVGLISLLFGGRTEEEVGGCQEAK